MRFRRAEITSVEEDKRDRYLVWKSFEGTRSTVDLLSHRGISSRHALEGQFWDLRRRRSNHSRFLANYSPRRKRVTRFLIAAELSSSSPTRGVQPPRITLIRATITQVARRY